MRGRREGVRVSGRERERVGRQDRRNQTQNISGV